MQTDCRGAGLVHLLALVVAATQPGADDGAAHGGSGGGEAPAAALVRALQSALGSSYLKKLQELADNDSSSGGSGGAAEGSVKAEGLLAVFSPGLSTVAQLQHFLGAAAAPGVAAAAAAASDDREAALQRLLGAALPAAVWQRCAAASLSVSWVAGGAAAGSTADDQQLAALPVLQALMHQHLPASGGCPAGRAGWRVQPGGVLRRGWRCRSPRRRQRPRCSGAATRRMRRAAGRRPADSQEEAVVTLKLLLAVQDGHKGGERGRCQRSVPPLWPPACSLFAP